ncbi:MAG: TIR domain-containing protein, partial [Pseudomonadota bacterium]
MADVFISYKSERRRAAEHLCRILTAHGFTVWYDVRGLRTGADFAGQIEQELTQAKAAVVLWCSLSRSSSWVREEAQFARDRGIYLPALIEPDINAPLGFSMAQHVDLRGWDGDPRGADLDDLFEALEELCKRDASVKLKELRGLQDDWEHYGKPNMLGFELDESEAMSEGLRLGDQTKRMSEADLRAEASRLLTEMGYRAAGSEIDLNVALAAVAQTLGLETITMIDQQSLTFLRVLAASKHRAPQSAPAAAAAGDMALDDLDVAESDVRLRLDPGMHTAKIGRVSLSADGTLMATASHDKTVKLWALPGGELIDTFRPSLGDGDEGKLYAVALDPEGHWVATAGWMTKSGLNEEFVAVFDTASGDVVARLGPLPIVTLSLALTADGRYLAAGLGGSAGVRVWEAPQPGDDTDGPLGGWRLVFEDSDFTGQVYGVAFAADGRLAATGYDGHVKLYSSDFKLLKSVKSTSGGRPFGLAFNPAGDRLAIGYTDCLEVDVLDAATLELEFVAKTNDSPDGSHSQVIWIDQPDPSQPSRLVGGGRSRFSVWPNNGRGEHIAWKAPSENTVHHMATLYDTEKKIGLLAVAAGGPSLTLFDEEGRRRLWMPPQIADLRNKRDEHYTISADGTRLRFGLEPFSRSPVLFDLGAEDKLVDAPYSIPELARPKLDGIPIDNWINSTNPTLSGEPLRMKPFETSFSLVVAPDEQSFVLGTHFQVRRYDINGDLIWGRPVPGVTWGVNLAREGRLLLAAYGDGTIRWHNAEDGKELLALFIHL